MASAKYCKTGPWGRQQNQPVDGQADADNEGNSGGQQGRPFDDQDDADNAGKPRQITRIELYRHKGTHCVAGIKVIYGTGGNKRVRMHGTSHMFSAALDLRPDEFVTKVSAAAVTIPDWGTPVLGAVRFITNLGQEVRLDGIYRHNFDVHPMAHARPPHNQVVPPPRLAFIFGSEHPKYKVIESLGFGWEEITVPGAVHGEDDAATMTDSLGKLLWCGPQCNRA